MRAPHLSIPKLADCRHAGIPPGASRLGLAASRRNLYSSIQWTFDLILTQGSDTLHQLTTSSDAATERPGIASVNVCHRLTVCVRALRPARSRSRSFGVPRKAVLYNRRCHPGMCKDCAKWFVNVQFNVQFS